MAPKSTDPNPSVPNDDPSRDADPAPDTPRDPELEKMLNDLADKIGPAVLGALQTDHKITAAEEARANEAKRNAFITDLWAGKPLHDKDGKPIEATPTSPHRSVSPDGRVWPSRFFPPRVHRGLGAMGVSMTSAEKAAPVRLSAHDRPHVIHEVHELLEKMPPSRRGTPLRTPGLCSPETADILEAYAQKPGAFGKGTFHMEMRSKSTHKRPDLIIRGRDGEPIEAINLSKLNVSSFPCPIAFCDDLTFRMYFGTELFGHHKGIPSGWGPFPTGKNFKALMQVLDGGNRTALDEHWRRGKSLFGILNDHTGRGYGP